MIVRQQEQLSESRKSPLGRKSHSHRQFTKAKHFIGRRSNPATVIIIHINFTERKLDTWNMDPALLPQAERKPRSERFSSKRPGPSIHLFKTTRLSSLLLSFFSPYIKRIPSYSLYLPDLSGMPEGKTEDRAGHSYSASLPPPLKT